MFFYWKCFYEEHQPPCQDYCSFIQKKRKKGSLTFNMCSPISKKKKKKQCKNEKPFDFIGTLKKTAGFLYNTTKI